MSNRRDVRIEFAGTLQHNRHDQLAVCLRAVSLMLVLAACNSTTSSAAPSARAKPAGRAPRVASANREPSAKADAVVTSAGDTKAPSAVAEPTANANKVAANIPAEAPGTKPAAPDDRCSEVCKRTVKLQCGSLQACMDACAEANDGSICDHEMSAFMTCALTHPVEHWECTENGVAAIKQGFCDSQQQEFVRCFEAAASNTN